MAKRESLESATCPVARAMSVIGDGWSMLIIRDVWLGLRRFSEIQKSLGLAKNILTMRLRALVAHGILKTQPAADGSAYQDYVLTPKGRAVFPIMVALRQWGEEFAFAPNELSNIMVDRKTGRRVRKLELHAADGRLLEPGDTELKPLAPAA
jgi:DNA-binding HxlR family transcriptional regulator